MTLPNSGARLQGLRNAVASGAWGKAVPLNSSKSICSMWVPPQPAVKCSLHLCNPTCPIWRCVHGFGRLLTTLGNVLQKLVPQRSRCCRASQRAVCWLQRWVMSPVWEGEEMHIARVGTYHTSDSPNLSHLFTRSTILV